MKIKTFEEIEAAIIEKENERENLSQVLAATKEMATAELEAAETAQAAADEAIDRKAYEKAAGDKWVAERKVAKAQRELEAFTDKNTDELIAIEEDLTNLSWDLNEEVNAFREEIYKSIIDRLEEVGEQAEKITALYNRLGELQGKEISQYGRCEISSRHRLKAAAKELEQLSHSAAWARAYAEQAAAAPATPGRLAQPIITA